EDPYLTARMGVAAVRGFHGTDSVIGPQHVFATLKHMTGHSQPESGTNVGPASIGERTLRDMFLYPFEVAIKEGGARSVMPSYNEIDGIPSHANRWMLRDVLRGEWGFDGTIVSDWFAIPQLIDRHHVARDSAEAARRALVLLKNDGNLLPLRAGAYSRIAVIGPHAAEVLLGGYSGTPPHVVSIPDGIKAKLQGAGTVQYAEGVRITEDSVFTREPQPHSGGTLSKFRSGADRVVPADSASNARRISEAVALARQSDLVILALGDNEQ